MVTGAYKGFIWIHMLNDVPIFLNESYVPHSYTHAHTLPHICCMHKTAFYTNMTLTERFALFALFCSISFIWCVRLCVQCNLKEGITNSVIFALKIIRFRWFSCHLYACIYPSDMDYRCWRFFYMVFFDRSGFYNIFFFLNSILAYSWVIRISQVLEKSVRIIKIKQINVRKNMIYYPISSC